MKIQLYRTQIYRYRGVHGGEIQNKWWARSLYEDIAQLKKRPFMMLLIIMALPAIYFTVYYTGGIKYVYSHSSTSQLF
jgi:hypothetical protein